MEEKQDEMMLYYVLFDGEQTADFSLGPIFDGKGSGPIPEVEDVVVVLQDKKGRVRVRQTKEVGKGGGALAGGAVGLLGGVLLTIPVLGLAAGAMLGARAAKKKHHDTGIDNQFLADVGKSLYPGSSAILLLLSNDQVSVLENRLAQYEVKTYKTGLADESMKRLETLVDETRGGD